MKKSGEKKNDYPNFGTLVKKKSNLKQFMVINFTKTWYLKQKRRGNRIKS